MMLKIWIVIILIIQELTKYYQTYEMLSPLYTHDGKKVRIYLPYICAGFLVILFKQQPPGPPLEPSK